MLNVDVSEKMAKKIKSRFILRLLR